VLDLGGAGSRALPNGLRDPPARRPYQDFYDERYFLKDAPPPARRAPPPVAPARETGRLGALGLGARTASASPAVSPSPSYGSASAPAPNGPAKDEKKDKEKKRRLFKF
jgi:syntaxin-binding protein 1